jgi:hypothetical protein
MDQTRHERAKPQRSERATVRARATEHERTHFRALVLANPNYFGNLKDSPYKPVKELLGNTSYEVLTCVGLNPQFSRLEAVVNINLDFGYGGDLCSSGTPEYVRFYVSFDSSATWQDMGISSFIARDITGPKPLEYAVTLQVSLGGKFCLVENLARVRAILSWDYAPPANTPSFVPAWGNVLEADVQIQPAEVLLVGDLINEAKITISKELEIVLDPSKPVALAAPKAMSVAELATEYQGTKVPSHRFLFAAAQQAITASTPSDYLAATAAQLEFDLAKAVATILETSGDTMFEDLSCVGLDPNLDTLNAVLTVKLASGYSGGLCTAGSQEYVAFWIDWGDGAGWTYTGTTSVNVHDIASIPPGGLNYGLFLPIDLTSKQQPCDKGPILPLVRAVLSWQAPPPPGNPDFLPTWGNRVETHIQVPPGQATPGHTPFIETVGSMAVSSINPVSGQANGPAVAAGFSATDSPFGGVVVLTGHIANPPYVLGGAIGLDYRVSVSSDGGVTWQPLNNQFPAALTYLTGGIWSGPFAITQAPTPDGWYTSYEDISGPNKRFVAENVLAKWLTGGPMTGIWQIKIDARDPSSNTVYPGVQLIAVDLDNATPTLQVDITSGGGACADFTAGTTIDGTYNVADEHFGSYTFSVQPVPVPLHPGTFTVNPSGGGAFTGMSPFSRSYPAIASAGEHGTWSLNTAGMQQCGYVIYLEASDRTIVNSGSVGWQATTVVGLCLRT